MAAGTRSEQNIGRTIARALKLTEEALAQVAQIAIEEIHTGLESSNHVEAAERDMRSALKQLVLAERELTSRYPPRRAGERPEGSGDVLRATDRDPGRAAELDSALDADGDSGRVADMDSA